MHKIACRVELIQLFGHVVAKMPGNFFISLVNFCFVRLKFPVWACTCLNGRDFFISFVNFCFVFLVSADDNWVFERINTENSHIVYDPVMLRVDYVPHVISFSTQMRISIPEFPQLSWLSQQTQEQIKSLDYGSLGVY